MSKEKKDKEGSKIGSYLIIVLLGILGISLGLLGAYVVLNPRIEEADSNYFLEENEIEMLEEEIIIEAIEEDTDEDELEEKVMDLEDIAKLKSAVVKIETEYSQGSGVLIDEEGYILTNYHVIADAYDWIHIKFNNREEEIYMEEGFARLVGYDSFLDLALLKVDQVPDWLEVKYLELGNPNNINDGERIITIGSPKGLTNTMSEGIISSIRIDEKRKDIQITAPISQGSSGGALLNKVGKLIGITTYKIVDGDNLNFAISLWDILDFLDREYKTSFTEYKEKKRVLGQGKIKDYYSGITNEFIVFSDNLKRRDGPYISPGYNYEYANEKLSNGHGKIAYTSDGIAFEVTGIDFYSIHYDDGINYRDPPLLNRELVDIPLYISIFDNREQIHILKSHDLNYSDLLLIGSYYQDDLWNIMMLSLEAGNFVEWGVEEYNGWSDNTGFATYIRRLYSHELEIINYYGESIVYKKYLIDPYYNIIKALDDGIEISSIDEYLSSGDWIKIGRLKK